MSSHYFSVSGITPLKIVPKGGCIHVIGVCGVAMAQLAVALSKLGYTVSGSDREYYEPMVNLLRHSAVILHTGYSVKHLHPKLDLVVIGNAVTSSNEEVCAVEQRKIPYSIFPALLYDLMIAGKQSIVVSGTHGKTTTTALLSYVCTQLSLAPSYFIGGVARDLPSSFELGSGKYSVVEGDEYDSSFFAKVPKFTFYRPHILVVTSVEYDHADIYPNLESINEQFNSLVLSLPPQAHVVVCIDDSNLRGLYGHWSNPSFWGSRAPCSFITYGESEQADVRLVHVQQEQGSQRVQLRTQTGELHQFQICILGMANAKNALAVTVVSELLGLEWATVRQALGTFQGVKRRQEVWLKEPITLIEDFAHHPTAVRETIAGVRASYPGRKLWALFEPRSNTSRRAIFKRDYVSAFGQADQVVLCEVSVRATDAQHELLDVHELSEAIRASGIDALALPDAPRIAEYVLGNVGRGDVVLVMSNGSFGGLMEKLVTIIGDSYWCP